MLNTALLKKLQKRTAVVFAEGFGMSGAHPDNAFISFHSEKNKVTVSASIIVRGKEYIVEEATDTNLEDALDGLRRALGE